MKYFFFFLFVTLAGLSSYAQSVMTKEIIAKNKVKTITKKEFDNNSNEGCNTTTTTYNKNGNIIRWNWQRIGSYFEYEYDDNDKKIAIIRRDKSDSTDVYIMKKKYDEFGNIISDNTDRFKNFYDNKNYLVKSVLLDEQGALTDTFKTYEYDVNNQVTKEIHYDNNIVENTILNTYDSSCRLIERIEFNKKRIKFRNEEYAAYKKPITYFLTNISYDEKGRITEKFQYHSDPCESMDDHYMSKNFYLSNDLLEKTEMFLRGRHISTTKYEYTYY